MSLLSDQLTPREIVKELDKFIIGQAAAKKAVAIALRNRWRRQQLPPSERAEVLPKNILMMGPTGVGKTEIARRLASLARAPFVKVEATKFTEVGYVGRDVESMIRDLAAASVRLVEAEQLEKMRVEAESAAYDRLASLLADKEEERLGIVRRGGFAQAIEAFGDVPGLTDEQRMTLIEQDAQAQEAEEGESREDLIARMKQELMDGQHRKTLVSVAFEEQGSSFMQVFGPQGMEEMGIDSNMFNNQLGGGTKYISREAAVEDAFEILVESEAKRRMDEPSIHKEAVHRAEQTGIIFLDEIDKIAIKSGGGGGPEVSREGVQRDLLPVIEGSTVPSKYGPINTDHILFIAAGAFHVSNPDDLIPELQGRLPIRVTLDSLGEDDFARILTEPKSSLMKQYQKLMAVDGVELSFTKEALDEVAHVAQELNNSTENIGARRLHTVMELLLEKLMFDAPENAEPQVEIGVEHVRRELKSS
jgi:ATP-dependent HslUV protease ATP-binding subunit HslU